MQTQISACEVEKKHSPTLMYVHICTYAVLELCALYVGVHAVSRREI